MRKIFVILILSVLAIIGCKPQKTEIILIGTISDMHYLSQHYSMAQLEEILSEVQPDIICVNMTPKHYINKDARFMLAEISQVIDPWAKKNNIPVYPVGWWDEDMIVQRNRFLQELQKSGKMEEYRKRLQNSAEYNDYVKLYDNPASITYKDVHSDSFLRITESYHNTLSNIYGEGAGTGWWEKRNEEMYNRLMEIVEKNKGKKIAFVMGSEYLYWFYKHLKQEEKVQVYLITEYKETIKEVGKDKTPVSAAIRLRTFLEAPIIDTLPESVDTTGLWDDVNILQKEDSSMANYYKGVLFFLSGNLQKADSLIQYAAMDTNAYLTRYIQLTPAAYLRLGKIYDYLGNRKKAKEFYKKSLKYPYKTATMRQEAEYGYIQRYVKPAKKSKLYKRIK